MTVSLGEFNDPNYPLYKSLPAGVLRFRDQLNRMISEKIIKFELTPCLCGSKNFTPISKFDRYRIKQDTVICESCGLIQSQPRMTLESSGWFYESDFYRKLYSSEVLVDNPNYIISQSKKRFGRFEFVKTNTEYQKIETVLEVGCGGGWNLYPYYLDGKKVIGFDYSPHLTNLGKKLGMDLRVGNFEEKLNRSLGKFDIIIFAHVLEHLNDPVGTMRKLGSFLNKNGLIYIEVPDTDFFGIHQLQSAHNYYFTERTLIHFAAVAGLKPIVIKKKITSTHIGGLFTLQDKVLSTSLAGEAARMRETITRYVADKSDKRSLKVFITKVRFTFKRIKKFIKSFIKKVIFRV